MSQTESEASDTEQGEPESDSVYDFLYHDVRRVGSFLAQFDDAGHLQQVTQSEGAMRSAKRGWKAGAGGSLPGVGSANLSLERGPQKGGFEASERVYDPLWTNARTLLDYLSERDMLRRSLNGASIGQFVLVNGQLMIMDLAMLKSAWENDAIKKLIRSNTNQPQVNGLNREQRRSQSKAPTQSGPTSELDVLIALLSMLPHALQCRLLGEGVNVWCNLDENSVVGQASDLILKHGALLQGQWHMLGILDAYPSGSEAGTADQLTDVLSEIAATPVGQVSVRLAPAARGLLGRPDAAYGMTPLLIFREISG